MSAFRPLARRHLWAIIGICAFLVFDALLVAWALTATHPSSPGKAGPIPTFTNYPQTFTPTPTSTDAPASASMTAAPRVLVAVSATEAYRATPGACTGGDTVIEKSTDAGATWNALDTSGYGFHTTLALYDATDTRLSAVEGAGASCAPSTYSSFTGGQFWQEYPQNLSSATYVDPEDASTIHTAAGAEDAPCSAALKVSAASNSTAVLCAGAVYTRTGSGDWSAAQIPGVLALTTAADSGYTLAVSGVTGCSGIAIETLAVGGASPTLTGCLTSATSPAGVTLARSGSTLWLWSNDTVSISGDGGVTW